MEQDRSPARGGWRLRLATALLVACTALPACSGGEDVTGAEETSGAGAGEEDAGEPQIDLGEAQPPGEEVQQERFAVTVDDLDCEAGEEIDGVEPAGRFCLLTIDVTNSTGTGQSLELDRQVLLDESGTEYAISYEATQAAAGDLEETIEAGASARITLVYDVPEDAWIVAARISDDASGEGVLVDLQG